MILVLCLLVMLPCCKKKLPTQADIPTKVLPTIEYFHATPEAISSGEVSILSWSVKNATNITIDHDVGTVSAKATVEVSPGETTTYTLTAINSDGQKTQSCTVTVADDLNLPVIDYFIANPESIIQGDLSRLSWSVQPEGLTEALRIEPLGNLTIPFEGSHMVCPTEATTYTLIAVNDDGETTASCSVAVLPNYEGTWSGSYVVTACNATEDFWRLEWCKSREPGMELLINLVLTQNVDLVIGSYYLGFVEEDADGTIAIDGQLLLTGFSEDVLGGSVFTTVSTLQLQSTVPGQITGTLVWTVKAEGFLDGSVQVSGDIITLNRNE